ncbi:dnaJ homolog subfamily C member 2-like [Ylistrum balloti]|uniref:dnaJ homolog subfamily C member 2-like n=1 Tax=Ylistrum balloti TaxID=509963 RepID=UPI002905B204|nr:dnaJ homolog subfamily C member 2-like [Ylistrum balloti]
MILPEATEGQTTELLGKITAPTVFQIEPVGRWYEALCARRRHKHSLSHHSLESSSSDESDDDEGMDDDGDDALLLGLDPREWKSQDHYAVLGLKKLRYKATENQIKKAYKNKVLKHHPDKRRARGVVVKGEGDDDYFTCITRAYEVLGSRTKRRSYDSVDPEFDDSIPSNNQQTKDSFFTSFGPVFERNARWNNSKKKKVPMLGDDNDSIDTVNHFYSFWYDFDSWREYSYLDEEEKEKGENREERRWIEKQNKAARLKKKKEESARIRLLVDNAYACDPRIQKFRDEEKEKKLAQKRAKQEAARQRAEEEERKKQEALEEERKKREKEEEEAKAQAAAAKKEKEAQKKILKKERKALRTSVKDMDYFATSEQERVSNMADVDRLADLLSLTKLQGLNEDLSSGDKDKAKTAFYLQVDELNKKLEEEKRAQLEAVHRQASGENSHSRVKEWKEEEVQFLIKAVNLFPAGTKDRWEVIASFIKQHVTASNKNARDVLGKAKDLQKNDTFLKQDADRKAFEKFEAQTAKPTAHTAKPKEGVTSERFESVGEQQIRETGTNPAPWTAEEQKLLEQSLKTFPANTPERWEKIAAVLPARSKKDCMKRYKELVELIRAKKAATEAAAKKK